MSDATVLIVDDDPDFLLQQKVQFEAAGYNTLTASTLEDVTKLLEQHTPDVAVVDLMMEEEDTGFVVCYQIKRRNPETIVIMATGVASETGIEFDAATDEERAWVKADALVSKPVRFEQLLREIDRLKTGRE